MTTPTKDQIRQLTPEQQETLASIEARRLKKREQLLRHARGYRGRIGIPVLLVVLLLGAFYFQAPMEVVVAYSFLGVLVLIRLHTEGINRRLDALMELLESDKRRDD